VGAFPCGLLALLLLLLLLLLQETPR